MEPSDLKADLEDLIASKGWAWLCRKATRDLDETMVDQMQGLLEGGADLNELRQLAAVRKYVMKTLLTSPYQKIQEIERVESARAEAPPAGHRRGKHV